MSSDPAVSGKDAIRALQNLGFRLDRIEGSHHMLIKEGIHTLLWFRSMVPSRSRKVLWRASFGSPAWARGGSLRSSGDEASAMIGQMQIIDLGYAIQQKCLSNLECDVISTLYPMPPSRGSGQARVT